MRLIVFGATGRTGQHVVRQAVERGHEVTAYVRNLSRWTGQHDQVRVVEGALDNAERLAAALVDMDAVVSTLGAGSGTLTTFARVVVPQMIRLKISRIVVLVGAATSDPIDTRSIGRTFMVTLMGLMAGDMLDDSNTHAALLRASSLDWTLVRPPRLSDGPLTGRVQSGATLSLGPMDSISRADLAAFMLDLATGNKFVRQAPMVAARR